MLNGAIVPSIVCAPLDYIQGEGRKIDAEYVICK